MGVACFCFLLGSLRTNLCFVIIFFTLLLAFALLSAAYWYLAEDYTGNAAKVGRYLVVSLSTPLREDSSGSFLSGVVVADFFSPFICARPRAL